MVTEGGYGLMAVIAAGVCECKARCGQCHCVILPLIKDDGFAVRGVRLYLPALFTGNPPFIVHFWLPASLTLIFNHSCSSQLRFFEVLRSGVNQLDDLEPCCHH